MLGPFVSSPMPNPGYPIMPLPYPFGYGLPMPSMIPSLHAPMEAEVLRKGEADKRGGINFLVNQDDEEDKRK
jgi:hypothetical protein